MGFFDKFRGKKEPPPGPDVTRGLTLFNMRPGWFVDYDLTTWQVQAYNIYDWSEGDIAQEWQLVSGDETVYLELQRDDVDDWSLNRKIDFAALGDEVRRAIMEKGDPPGEVTFEGVTYYQEEMAGGAFLKNGQAPGQNMLRWDYEDEEGERFLTIEQWGEEDFLAYQGRPAQEYQFTNLLPPA